MLETNDIKKIRILLESYYGGEASREEIAQLASLFSSVPDLPQDLTKERDVFLMIENPLLSSEQDISVPDYLENNISRDLSGRNRRYLFRRFVKIAASAAVLVLVLTVGWRAIDIASKDVRLQTKSTGEMASVSSTDDDHSAQVNLNDNSLSALRSSDQEVSSDKEDYSAQAVSHVKGGLKKNRNVRKTSQLASANGSTKTGATIKSNKREITDPEEAAVIVDQVMVMMNQNMFAVENACEESDMRLESINRKLISVNL